MMSSAVFIVWRESVEALLIIALLQRCLSARFSRRDVIRILGAGVAIGLLIALLLAFAMQQVSDDASAEKMEWLQLAIVLAAAGLLIYTVTWLHRQSVNLKQQLQQQLVASQQRAGIVGVILVTSLAVAREGAETVLFLYGIVMAQGSATVLPSALLGLLLALLTYVGLSRASRYLSWPHFFRLSQLLLLLLAGALLVDASDRLIGLGWLPAGIDPLFDISAWLDDSAGAGRWLAAFSGFRARPALTTVLVLTSYWALITTALRRMSRQ